MTFSMLILIFVVCFNKKFLKLSLFYVIIIMYIYIDSGILHKNAFGEVGCFAAKVAFDVP